MTATKMNVVEKEKGGRMVLPLSVQLSYSVGHVLNDLCASMWFSYLLLFLNLVLGLSSELSGFLMLIGQIFDGISTPIVGFFSDRASLCPCCRYGKRKSWHLLGTICVLCSFPFVFTSCLGCSDSSLWVKAVYYGIFICIFQFGWAAVQISNLSAVPELTPDEHERTALLAYRYSFTVISSMAVYIITWIAIRIGSGGTNKIGPDDEKSFFYTMIIVVCIGSCMSFLYHLGVPERGQDDALIGDGSERPAKIRIVDLFKDIHLYKVAVVYTCTRLFLNMSQVLIPLYLQFYLQLRAESVAFVPLTVFISSFVTSLIIKQLNKSLGRRIAFFLGGVIGIAASVLIYFGKGDFYEKYLVNLTAALFGCGGSIMLVTSLGVTADHIGEDYDNGAFIYGIMSTLDKISNGIVVMIVQSVGCVACRDHYRDSLTYVCGLSAIIGILGILTFKKPIRRRGDYVAKENLGFDYDEGNSTSVSDNNQAAITDDLNNKKSLPTTTVVREIVPSTGTNGACVHPPSSVSSNEEHHTVVQHDVQHHVHS